MFLGLKGRSRMTKLTPSQSFQGRNLVAFQNPLLKGAFNVTWFALKWCSIGVNFVILDLPFKPKNIPFFICIGTLNNILRGWGDLRFRLIFWLFWFDFCRWQNKYSRVNVL